MHTTELKVKKNVIFLLLLAGMSWSCSQFSNSITSKSWHNLNAHYNALWIAEENFRFIEDTLFQIRTDDYTKILPVLLPIDTLKNQVVSQEIEEVIRKSSIIAERHSNSRYLDQAYNLLGKARLLKGDFLNAAEVFKYVNTNGTNEFQKHQSLIMLMRTYIEMGDLASANQVSDIIKAMGLKEDNLREYYLTKAYYHQQVGEPLITAAILDEALKIMPKGERKARTYFIAGQIYQANNRPDLAVERYKMVDKNKPNYDLTFYSEVNELAALTSGRSGVDAEATYNAMLQDRKNKDFKDLIYLKMGEVEANKENFAKAINYYNLSVRNTTKKENAAAAYLAIGDIYYDDLQKYGLAAHYYDSTLINLPPTDARYKRISTKSSSLVSFIKYREAIDLEDSLQALAKLNPVALDKQLDVILAKKSEDSEKIKQLISEKSDEPSVPTTGRLSANRWELYDPVKINQGKIAFAKQWGSRTLEDNWRRRDQQGGAFSVKLERLNEADIRAEEQKNAEKIAQEEKDRQAAANSEKEQLRQLIPTTPEKLAASNARLQEALFQLGKLYKLQFNEDENARQTFIEFINRFPDSPNVPEALYFLSLMSDNKTDNSYRSTLLAKYPSSPFARQVDRGQVEVSSGTETAAVTFYKGLFDTYAAGNYTQVISMADGGLKTYMGTSVEDKIAMLRILSLAKGQDVDTYKQALEDFKLSYPNSDLLPKVESLEAAIAKQ